MLHRLWIILLLLPIAHSVPILGQVADTLDAPGYLPLAIGNVWEYEHDMIRPASPLDPVDRSETRYERLNVAGTSLRSDTLWYLLDFQERSETNELLVYRRFEVRYDTTSASIIGGPGLFGALRCLDSDFGLHDAGPYDCWPFVSQDEMLFPDLFGVEAVPVKSLFSYVWGVRVVHKIGPVYMGGGCEPCGVRDDSDHWRLKYAVLGESTYGTQIVRVDSDPPGAEHNLRVYPNPTHGPLTVLPSDDKPVEIFNVIGQRIRRHAVGPSAKIELNLADLPSGFYLVRSGVETVLVLLR